ncbi:MAG: DNA primase [Xanthomonadales bacterium]|nr:DNA primase [Xanthomonadales bacterium]
MKYASLYVAPFANISEEPVKSAWIDFREIKSGLDVGAVLAFFGVHLRGKGDQLHGFCPLPGHRKRNDRAKSPSFSVNLSLKAFHCFGCGASGNMLEFACLMEGESPEDPAALRRAALRIGGPRGCAAPAALRVAPAAAELPVPTSAEIVNAALGFELTDLDRSHPYLLERGFGTEVISTFGLGVARKGMMKDRVAIPIHDAKGSLIAYAGRIVDDARISADCPRYLFPGDREKDGIRYVFRKSELLYNAHRVKALGRRGVIVVESYTAAWWLHQAGFPNVVAVMGSSMSDAQADLLVRELQPSFVVILGDGDEAGKRMAASALVLLAPHVWTRWESLVENQQPTDLGADALRVRLGKHFGK